MSSSKDDEYGGDREAFWHKVMGLDLTHRDEDSVIPTTADMESDAEVYKEALKAVWLRLALIHTRDAYLTDKDVERFDKGTLLLVMGISVSEFKRLVQAQLDFMIDEDIVEAIFHKQHDVRRAESDEKRKKRREALKASDWWLSDAVSREEREARSGGKDKKVWFTPGRNAKRKAIDDDEDDDDERSLNRPVKRVRRGEDEE